MPPVIIKSEQLLDGLWFSQGVLIIIILSGLFILPWPWLLISLPLILIMVLNHHKIIENQSGALRLNTQEQWFWQKADRLQSCHLRSHWHTGGVLWIQLESEEGQHHCLIIKSRIGGASYAQLLMAVNQNEQQTE